MKNKIIITLSWIIIWFIYLFVTQGINYAKDFSSAKAISKDWTYYSEKIINGDKTIKVYKKTEELEEVKKVLIKLRGEVEEKSKELELMKKEKEWALLKIEEKYKNNINILKEKYNIKKNILELNIKKKETIIKNFNIKILKAIKEIDKIKNKDYVIFNLDEFKKKALTLMEYDKIIRDKYKEKIVKVPQFFKINKWKEEAYSKLLWTLCNYTYYNIDKNMVYCKVDNIKSVINNLWGIKF